MTPDDPLVEKANLEKIAKKIIAPCREWFSKYGNKIDHSKRIRLGLLRKNIVEALSEYGKEREKAAFEEAARIAESSRLLNEDAHEIWTMGFEAAKKGITKAIRSRIEEKK